MREKDIADVSKKLTELMFRTHYTYRDETREAGDITVGSHAFGVLTKVYYSEKIHTVNELSAMMHMQNPQLSKLLTAIEKEGYIVRTRPKDNRRSVEITITDKGKAYVEGMMSIIENKIAEDLAQKDGGDLTPVKKALDQLYCALYID